MTEFAHLMNARPEHLDQMRRNASMALEKSAASLRPKLEFVHPTGGLIRAGERLAGRDPDAPNVISLVRRLTGRR